MSLADMAARFVTDLIQSTAGTQMEPRFPRRPSSLDIRQHVCLGEVPENLHNLLRQSIGQEQVAEELAEQLQNYHGSSDTELLEMLQAATKKASNLRELFWMMLNDTMHLEDVSELSIHEGWTIYTPDVPRSQKVELSRLRLVGAGIHLG